MVQLEPIIMAHLYAIIVWCGCYIFESNRSINFKWEF